MIATDRKTHPCVSIEYFRSDMIDPGKYLLLICRISYLCIAADVVALIRIKCGFHAKYWTIQMLVIKRKDRHNA